VTLGGEAKRRHDFVIALKCKQRALELLHEARVLETEWDAELGASGSFIIFGLESWMEDSRDKLEPH
jgi:hypothetical protein